MKYWCHKSVLMLLAVLMWLPAAGARGGQDPTMSMNWVRLYHFFDVMETNGKDIVLSRGSDLLRFVGNSRRLELNGIIVWMNEPLVQKRGGWRISKADLEKTVMPMLSPSEFLGGVKASLVVLDAGHGGRDAGVTDPWNGQEEKNLVLQLAEKARDILLERNVAVCLTRTEDEWMDLEERCKLAAGFGADVFVSIHLNAATNPEASGVETYVLALPGSHVTATPSSEGERNAAIHVGNGHDAANAVLGYMLQRKLVEHSGSIDRGVRRSRFHVLCNSACPAALVECGFLSNKEESGRFLDTAYLDMIAEAIADGILAYTEEVGKTGQ